MLSATKVYKVTVLCKEDENIAEISFNAFLDNIHIKKGFLEIAPEDHPVKFVVFPPGAWERYTIEEEK